MNISALLLRVPFSKPTSWRVILTMFAACQYTTLLISSPLFRRSGSMKVYKIWGESQTNKALVGTIMNCQSYSTAMINAFVMSRDPSSVRDNDRTWDSERQHQLSDAIVSWSIRLVIYEKETCNNIWFMSKHCISECRILIARSTIISCENKKNSTGFGHIYLEKSEFFSKI